ncbi:hypothetical protein LMG29542_00132 [Paraburkholderia humisilvae]|uniref:Lipoprotein n=1 Tax=Paraburkholderia humisilvae TaxID=627669 RepID=A0A6J5CYU2_9BURK|nr:hypothetical protein LMG29542_00132 [Paraburkholderia humisilvae]
MRHLLIVALWIPSSACFAASNCDQVKNNCVESYKGNVKACGDSADRRAGICRAAAYNKYIECLRAGGCDE